MQQDWSWKASAQRYLEVYAHACRRHHEERERLKADNRVEAQRSWSWSRPCPNTAKTRCRAAG